MSNIQMDLFGNDTEIGSHTPEWHLKNRPAPDPDSPIIVSYGGGRNSTAMLIAMRLKNIVPDLILFADTGAELPETYQYIQLFNKWLKANNFPEITTVQAKEVQEPKVRKRILRKANSGLKNFYLAFLDLYLCIFQNIRQEMVYQNLEEECIVLQSLPSKTYGHSKCSSRHKISPIQSKIKQWTRENGIRSQPRSFIGFHCDEQYRMFDKSGRLREFEEKGIRKDFPLIEWGINQQDCENLIKSAGLPIPTKSSCFFCPNRKISEVIELKQKHPDLYQRAVFLEQNMATIPGSGIKGLGRNWAWGDLDKLTPLEQALIDANQHSRSCTCTD